MVVVASSMDIPRLHRSTEQFDVQPASVPRTVSLEGCALVASGEYVGVFRTSKMHLFIAFRSQRGSIVVVEFRTDGASWVGGENNATPCISPFFLFTPLVVYIYTMYAYTSRLSSTRV